MGLGAGAGEPGRPRIPASGSAQFRARSTSWRRRRREAASLPPRHRRVKQRQWPTGASPRRRHRGGASHWGSCGGAGGPLPLRRAERRQDGARRPGRRSAAVMELECHGPCSLPAVLLRRRCSVRAGQDRSWRPCASWRRGRRRRRREEEQARTRGAELLFLLPAASRHCGALALPPRPSSSLIMLVAIRHPGSVVLVVGAPSRSLASFLHRGRLRRARRLRSRGGSRRGSSRYNSGGDDACG
jgi:hypothetical protein